MYYTSVIVTICTNLLCVMGLALLTGFTGMFSLGHAGFMAIGAYTAVLLNRYLAVPYIATLVAGGCLAMLVSIIVGYPTLKNRLRGDYFAICMLGFGTVVTVILNNTKTGSIFNGALGITSIPQLTSLWAALIISALMVFFIWNFVHSQYGRNCLAVQQQEVAAEMMGVDILKTKLLSLMISAFYAGIAGGILAFWLRYINPSTFSDVKSNDFLATLVTGGTNSITGPFLASIFVTTALEFLRALVNWRLVLYGAMYVIIMRFRPQGFLGYKEFSLKKTIAFFRDFKGSMARIKEKQAAKRDAKAKGGGQ